MSIPSALPLSRLAPAVTCAMIALAGCGKSKQDPLAAPKGPPPAASETRPSPSPAPAVEAASEATAATAQGDSARVNQGTVGQMELGAGSHAKAGFPDVTLTDQDGRKVRFVSDVIKGKIVFFNSFFTSCGGTCPVQSSVFSALQKRLGARVGKDVVLVSVTVDPENDTPAVLKNYAAKYGATPGWYFLTGEEKDLQKVLEAMDLYAKRPEEHSPMAAVGHEPSMRWRMVLNLKAPTALEAELKALEQDIADRPPVPGT